MSLRTNRLHGTEHRDFGQHCSASTVPPGSIRPFASIAPLGGTDGPGVRPRNDRWHQAFTCVDPERRSALRGRL